ncbi:unnamed protein product, partial [Nesidiocoris tenuis]
MDGAGWPIAPVSLTRVVLDGGAESQDGPPPMAVLYNRNWKEFPQYRALGFDSEELPDDLGW